jgi:thioredoxin reductase (NADPH)
LVREYDLVIIGAGVAGLTAAMFGGRYGLKVAVVDQMGAGGQIVNAEKIENFPGFPQAVAGYELGPMIQEQADNAGAEFLMDTVEALAPADGAYLVRGAEETLQARAVIVAAGSTLRTLGVPGEERLNGKGVSHCASCDGPFFVGQPVGVIGGGDSAVDEALVLTEYASQVTLFHRGAHPEAQRALLDKLAAAPTIALAPASEVEEICGEELVSGLRVRDLAGNSHLHELSGVFVYVGLEPNTTFLRGVVDLDPTGHIETDIMMRTSVPGIYAAGDIRKSSVAQLAAAAGDGATAATAAYRYVKSRE